MYNKKRIFKLAWERVKVIGEKLSDALKYAWRIAKKASVLTDYMLDRYKRIVSWYGGPDVDVQQTAMARAVVNYLGTR